MFKSKILALSNVSSAHLKIVLYISLEFIFYNSICCVQKKYFYELFFFKGKDKGGGKRRKKNTWKTQLYSKTC